MYIDNIIRCRLSIKLFFGKKRLSINLYMSLCNIDLLFYIYRVKEIS